jgi:hypothetical protein
MDISIAFLLARFGFRAIIKLLPPKRGWLGLIEGIGSWPPPQSFFGGQVCLLTADTFIISRNF